MGAPPSAYLDLLMRQILAAGAAGIDLVQIRETDLEARPLAALVVVAVAAVERRAGRRRTTTAPASFNCLTARL
jgi:hypothetical protein